MNQAIEKWIVGHHEEAAKVLEFLSNQQRQDGRLVALEAAVGVVKARSGASQPAPYAREFGWR
jgi:hypothetical protein